MSTIKDVAAVLSNAPRQSDYLALATDTWNKGTRKCVANGYATFRDAMIAAVIVDCDLLRPHIPLDQLAGFFAAIATIRNVLSGSQNTKIVHKMIAAVMRGQPTGIDLGDFDGADLVDGPDDEGEFPDNEP